MAHGKSSKHSGAGDASRLTNRHPASTLGATAPVTKLSFASLCREQGWLICLLLFLLVVWVFWPAVHNDFVNFDDPEYVSSNGYVQNGFTPAGLQWAFGFHKETAYWAPLTWLSYMLDGTIFGLQPWGYHLTNVLLHAANTVLVFLVLRRMTGAGWRSLGVALFFGLHPLRVESVAWVTERKDVLSGLFFMLTLWAYVRYVQQQGAAPPSSRSTALVHSLPSLPLHPSSLLLASFSFLLAPFWWLALLCYAGGLMSKPMLVTLPFVLLLLDYWPLNRLSYSAPLASGSPQRFWFRLVVEKLPFLGLAAGASVLTILAQQRGGALMSSVVMPLEARAANALVSYCRYLGHLFWPLDLAVFYPHPGSWPPVQVLLAGGLLLGISLVVFKLWRQCPYLLVGWLWFLGTLAPVIGLVQAGLVSMADRFTYVPGLGLLIILFWGAAEWTRRWRYRAAILSVSAAALAFFCLLLTRNGIAHWKDSVSLWTHTLACTSENSFAHNNLGNALADLGKLPEAIQQFEQALQLNPDYAEAHSNLGNALTRQGRLAEAVAHFERALQLQPASAEVHINLANALTAQGRLPEAIQHCQRALQLDPDSAEARINLGNALFNQGKLTEALPHYGRALQLKPDFVDAHINLGNTLTRLGRWPEAIPHYERALQLNPDSALAHMNLGNALNLQGKVPAALQQFQQALQLAIAQNDAALADAIRSRLQSLSSP